MFNLCPQKLKKLKKKKNNYKFIYTKDLKINLKMKKN